MSSVRLTSKKTLPILLQALRLRRFSQIELSQQTGVSIGRVNKVITWLAEKGVVVKENGKYEITQPNRVADMVAEQQVITQTRSYHVRIEEKDLRRLANAAASTTCLRSSLSTHDLSQPTSQTHLLDTDELRTQLDKQPRGDHIVNLYSYDTPADDLNEAIRTIIDLRSVGERHRTEELALKTWGTYQ